MVKSDTYVVIFYSLLQLTTSWADDSHEHVHIKLHLPEVVRKHTHMRMIYKHHFHPKKIKFHDHPELDTLPLLGPPFHAPEVPNLFKLGIKSQIIDVKKPKIKFPKLGDWELENSIPTFSTMGKFKNNLRHSFPMKVAEFALPEDMVHFPQKFSQIEEEEDEIMPANSEGSFPSEFTMYDSNFSHSDSLLPAQWPYSSLKDQAMSSSARWPLASNDWSDIRKYPFRSSAGNDDKVIQALEAYKTNFNNALELPLDRFEKNQNRFKMRGNHRFRNKKTSI